MTERGWGHVKNFKIDKKLTHDPATYPLALIFLKRCLHDNLKEFVHANDTNDFFVSATTYKRHHHLAE
jgi:hypothetical protein